MPSNDRLDRAFQALHKMGLIAKQNHRCCQDSAGTDIYGYIAERMAEGQPAPLGVCFYHERDADDRDAYDDFYLTYGEGHPDKTDEPLCRKEVGRRVVAVLYEHRIETEWNGNADCRIRVLSSSLWDDDVGYLAHQLRQQRRRVPVSAMN